MGEVFEVGDEILFMDKDGSTFNGKIVWASSNDKWIRIKGKEAEDEEGGTIDGASDGIYNTDYIQWAQLTPK